MLTTKLDVTYVIIWSVALANVLGTAICFAFSNQFAKIAMIRPDRNYAAHFNSVIYRRLPGDPKLGRSHRDAALRSSRLDHETSALAAAADHPGRRARRNRRALFVHISRTIRCRMAVAPRGDGRACDVALGSAAPIDQRDETSGGISSLVSGYSKAQFDKNSVFYIFFMGLIAVMIATAIPLNFTAMLVPVVSAFSP